MWAESQGAQEVAPVEGLSSMSRSLTEHGERAHAQECEGGQQGSE